MVSVLMRPDLGWPPAPHLPSSSWLAPAIYLFRAYKYPVKVGADSAEGHSIKGMMSLAMVAVLQRGISPDGQIWDGRQLHSLPPSYVAAAI